MKQYDLEFEKIDGLKEIKAEIGVVLGSGWGELVDKLKILKSFDLSVLETTALLGHRRRLHWVELPSGKRAVIMQGRFHYYEGYGMEKVISPIFMMQKLGVKKLVLTNAAGGINPDFSEGDIMIIEDHINMMGVNPLVGIDDSFGSRFVNMTEPYSFELMEKMEKIGRSKGLCLRKGIYAGTCGPSFETKAEYRMLKMMGGDVVGMSTIPECIAANYLGVKVLGLSVVSNVEDGKSKNETSHQKVLENVNKGLETFKIFFEELLDTL